MRITRLLEADRPRWAELWREYLTFYDTVLPEAVYDHTWARLLADREMHGFGARDDAGRLHGITHFLYHAHGWTTHRACYLQDLFVDAPSRSQGAARRLIEAVADHSRSHGADRLYWLTQDHNATARRLYDRIAAHRGFIKYDYPTLLG